MRAFGIIHKCVTEPLWEKTKAADNKLSLNGQLHHLQLKLIEWKEDASPLLIGDMGVQHTHLKEDEISEALFKECHDSTGVRASVRCITSASVKTNYQEGNTGIQPKKPNNSTPMTRQEMWLVSATLRY